MLFIMNISIPNIPLYIPSTYSVYTVFAMLIYPVSLHLTRILPLSFYILGTFLSYVCGGAEATFIHCPIY